jgi:hypothetical protein
MRPEAAFIMGFLSIPVERAIVLFTACNARLAVLLTDW